MKHASKLVMLHSSIHQMTKAEKRLFRFEMNKLKKDTAYSKLFDYLLILELYDEERIKAYVQKKEIRGFNTNVAHLFDKLITFLTNHRPPSRNSMVRRKTKQMLEEAETIQQLGFPVRAHKMMKKALKMALENEHYHLVNRCLKVMFLIENLYPHLQLSHTDIVGTTPTELDVRKFVKLEGISIELYILMIRAERLYFNVNTTEEDWNLIMANTTLKNIDWNTLNFLNKTRVLRINIRYNIWTFEYKNILQQCKKLLNFYEESDETLTFFQEFIGDYKICCQILYTTKHSDFEKYALDFNQLINKYESGVKAVLPEAKFKEILLIHQLMNRVIQQYNILLLDSFTIQDADRWSYDIKMESIRPWSEHRFQSLILSAYMYLLLEQYDRFHDYRNIILKYKEEINKHAIMRWELEVLDLIEIYENNTYKYFAIYLKNSIRKNKLKVAAHEVIVYIFELFNKLKKTASPKEVFETALSEIRTLESKARFHTLHFSTWVRWRCR